MIEVSRTIHRNENWLRLTFEYNSELISEIKKINSCRWSKTLKSWLIADNKITLDELLQVFDPSLLRFEAGILPEIKSDQPVIIDKLSITIEIINRKIRLRMPKNQADIDFVRTLRFSRWLSNDFCWEIPDYPGNIDLLANYFGKRLISITRHETIAINSGNEEARTIKANEVLLLKTVSGRIKIFSSYNIQLINEIRKIPYHRWDSKNKWWSIPDSDIFMNNIEEICRQNQLEIRIEEEKLSEAKQKRISRFDIPNYREAPEIFTNKLTELRYSANTVRHYITAFEEFINYYHKQEINTITEPQILEYIRYLITVRGLSQSAQNTAINAIKFYFEKVLKQQRKFYYLDRPKREKTLPEVLNTEETKLLISSVDNLKHKLIIMFGYSSGLRLGEICRIKLSDIDRERMQLRVEQGKGKKDRYTKLSSKILPYLDKYIEEENPGIYVFRGQYGELYSPRSIQNVVKAALKKAGINKKASTRTLRHTFATHSLENGVDLRYIQEMMGHASTTTTEIYTHITTRGFDKIKSPMDDMDI